jgi:hypothetical protein
LRFLPLEFRDFEFCDWAGQALRLDIVPLGTSRFKVPLALRSSLEVALSRELLPLRVPKPHRQHGQRVTALVASDDGGEVVARETFAFPRPANIQHAQRLPDGQIAHLPAVRGFKTEFTPPSLCTPHGLATVAISFAWLAVHGGHSFYVMVIVLFSVQLLATALASGYLTVGVLLKR